MKRVRRLPVWTVRRGVDNRYCRRRRRGWVLAAPSPDGTQWWTMWKKSAITLARLLSQDFGPFSLRIYGTDGRIQQERTYPRSADPRRSRG